MKIVVSEYMDAEGVRLLEGAGHTVVYDPTLVDHPTELKRCLDDADALLVRNQTRVNGEFVAGAAKLKVVGRLGVGLDNISVADLKERGIALTWARGSNAVSVAEYVMAVILELSRRLRDHSHNVHRGVWDRESLMGSELTGKTVGIIGVGDIGSRVARRAVAFGMTVLGNDPYLNDSSPPVGEYGVELMELADLLGRSDFVSLNVPLNAETRHMMNSDTISRMKPSSYLINSARGGLIDEAALAHALASGHLAGAALDVRESEPPGPDDQLAGLPAVILTPHIAGVSFEANRRISMHVAEDVLKVLCGEEPVSRVPASM